MPPLKYQWRISNIFYTIEVIKSVLRVPGSEDCNEISADAVPEREIHIKANKNNNKREKEEYKDSPKEKGLVETSESRRTEAEREEKTGQESDKTKTSWLFPSESRKTAYY